MMSESRTNDFFRPWRVSETANGTLPGAAAGSRGNDALRDAQRCAGRRRHHDDDDNDDDNESVASSTSDSTTSATSVPTVPTTSGDNNDDRLSDRDATSIVSTSSSRGRTGRRGGSESSDDVATSTTASLQGDSAVVIANRDESLDRRPTTVPMSRDDDDDDDDNDDDDDDVARRDAGREFTDGARGDLSPLEYLTTQLAFPRPEDFAPTSGVAYAATPIASSDLAAAVPGFYPVHSYHHPAALHPGIHHRGVQPGYVYPGLLSSPGLCDRRSVEEAVRMVHRQDAAAKRMKKMRPKKFRCQHCDMAFSNNGQLKGHVRIHTGERPFKCDVESCGKSFTRNEELTRHKRIHTGVRPHSCAVCGKRFGRKDHLKKHTRTHEVRDPYRCVSAAALSVFALGHPFQQAAAAVHIPDLPPYVYQI